jgi:hypothetical protein
MGHNLPPTSFKTTENRCRLFESGQRDVPTFWGCGDPVGGEYTGAEQGGS